MTTGKTAQPAVQSTGCGVGNPRREDTPCNGDNHMTAGLGRYSDGYQSEPRKQFFALLKEVTGR